MDSYHIFQKISNGAKLSRGLRQVAPRIPESGSQCVKKAPLLKKSDIKVETIDNLFSKQPSKWHNPSKLDNSISNVDSNVLQNSEVFTRKGYFISDDETSNDEEEEKDDKLNVLSDSKKFIVKKEQPLTLLGSMTATDSTQIRSLGKKMKVTKMKTNKQKLQSLEEEKINHLRNVHHISVNGTQVAPPIQTFGQLCEDYSISPVIINNIYNSGYSVPTPIQMQAIPAMLQGRQILACAPTGSGKTAAFLVPLIHNLGSSSRKGLRALVVCPTRELARQTLRECTKLAEGTGLRSHIISKAGASLEKIGTKLSKKFDILITTPNRLVYILKQEPSPLCLKTVEWLVVDESDKLFEVGVRGFRDQLAAIYTACDAANVKRAMFSATYTVQVAKWCRQNLKRLVCITVGQRNTAVELIEQELIFVGSENGKLIAFRDLVHKGMAPPVLIFVQSKERAKELFNELIFDGINVDVIHADRTQLQRDNVVRAFREGKIWVLICTELMGRGMDFKGVNLVINYDFPPSAIAYIHRIGRTGRAGRPGKAITFFTEDDKPLLRSIARVMQASGCKVPDYMLSIKRTSKRVKRQLERSAPDRKPISTMPGYQKYRQNKMKRWIEGSKKKSGTQRSSEISH